MADVNSKDVMKLRQITGLGMMDCKKALIETNGDFEEAQEYLRKKGISKGESRQGRSMGEGLVDSYIHPGSRIGVLLEVGCETDFVARSDDFKALVHDLAMQIAAASPLAVRREEISQEIIDKEMEIYREQLAEEKKPPEIVEKIAEGKLNKFFQERCLLEQQFVKDSKVMVKDYVLQMSGKLKENIEVRRFARFTLGE
ncbi:translation elongation factor Ts [Calditrichota bacterium]